MVSGTAHHLYYSMFMLMLSIATFLDSTVLSKSAVNFECLCGKINK